MPSVKSSSVPKVFDSSTVTHAVLADLVDGVGDDLADRLVSGRDRGDGRDVVLVVDDLGLLDDRRGRRLRRRFSMPRLISIGLAPAATFFIPALTIACASTVAVVVPSPAMSSVLVATSFTSWAPMFSKTSSSSISLAIDTPSLVIVGAPNSSCRARRCGPSDRSWTLTAFASLLTPASSARRASSSNFRIFAMLCLSP